MLTLQTVDVRVKKTQGSSAGLLLGLAALGITLWGAERWRAHVARRAYSSERARASALLRCSLGDDALEVLRSPTQTRVRLRTLAMQTPADLGLSWLDRCVPIARSLALHASEIDYAKRPDETVTGLQMSSRNLLAEIDRVGLAWRVRSGDPSLDMSQLGEALLRVTTDLSIRSLQAAQPTDPVAPASIPLSHGVLVAAPSVEPIPLGDGQRFLAGAPLPGLIEVSLRDEQWTTRTIADTHTHAYELRPQGFFRIDTRTGRTSDQLTDLRWIRPGENPAAFRIAAVDQPIDGLHVSLDGFIAPRSGAFWLGQWTPWNGAVLARHTLGHAWASFTVANVLPELTARASDPLRGATRNHDEQVAVAPLGRGAAIAFTQRNDRRMRVSVSAAGDDSSRAPMVSLGEILVSTARPGLAFCARPDGNAWLFVASPREWIVAEVTPERLSERIRVHAPPGVAMGSSIHLDCTESDALAQALEHGSTSPVLLCDDDRCRAIQPPELHQTTTMPSYHTRSVSGRSVIHGDWPVRVVRIANRLVRARAAGAVIAVTVADIQSGVWDAERVVSDLALTTPHAMAEGLGLYRAGEDLTLAASSAEGLRIFQSSDQGASWR
ncbi:MAG: hypothetical protein Q8Q09_13545 [Deltaproteobacteria bacterium]|nr:hypothetical protein [Deltaproteobacteria bacterium]